MSTTYAGNIALICPDCGTHLINASPSCERYHCSDCDLRLVRQRDAVELQKIRLGEVVGVIDAEELQSEVIWRLPELTPAY